jgi:hypothetical protein
MSIIGVDNEKHVEKDVHRKVKNEKCGLSKRL